jgi:succinate dehydrogenase/fumarate reductase-like Fe-S protein
MAEGYIQVEIFRYLPEDRVRRIDTFKVPYHSGMTVQTMLRYFEVS